jgi:hypothetical protein
LGTTRWGAFVAAAALPVLPGAAHAQGAKLLTKCPPDAVVAGTACVDKYEASVRRIADPEGKTKGVVKKIREGKVKPVEVGGFATIGVFGDDWAPCADNG